MVAVKSRSQNKRSGNKAESKRSGKGKCQAHYSNREMVQFLKGNGFAMSHTVGSHFKFRDNSGHEVMLSLHKPGEYANNFRFRQLLRKMKVQP